VSVVEITTFRLAPGVDDDAFLRADRRVQTQLVPNQPGFMRRTTAREGSAWVVVVLWASRDAASAFDDVARAHPAQAEFQHHLDRASVEAHRFDTLD
jgi:heme-degrading monooxygenase HmoA